MSNEPSIKTTQACVLDFSAVAKTMSDRCLSNLMSQLPLDSEEYDILTAVCAERREQASRPGSDSGR